MVPEKYCVRILRSGLTSNVLNNEFGIAPKTESDWDVLMNATNRLVPSTLPPRYTAKDIDLFAEGMFTIKQAADHLCLNRATLYRAMERGELPFYKMGKARRIPRVALRIWAEAY